MRRRTPSLLVLLAVAGAAIPAAPAAAKGLTGLSVCGAHGCVDRSDRIGPPAAARDLLEGARANVADPGPAPYVRLKLHVGDGGQTYGITTALFLPTSGIQQRDDGTWILPTPETVARLRRIVRGVALLPASSMPVHRPPAGPPIPEAPAVARPLAATAHDGAGDGRSGGVLIAAGVAVLAALGGGVTLVLRRRRPTDPREWPAIG